MNRPAKNATTALRRYRLAKRRRKPVAGHRAAYWKSRWRYWRRRSRTAGPGGFRHSMLNGHPGNITPATKAFIARAYHAGLYVTSTTDLRHATGSHHYPRNNPRVQLGRAADVAGHPKKMAAFQRSEARHPSRYLELFGPDNTANVKNGNRIILAEGTALEQLHDTHVHGALK